MAVLLHKGRKKGGGRKRKRENRKREKVATESGIEDKTLVYLLMGRLGS